MNASAEGRGRENGVTTSLKRFVLSFERAVHMQFLGSIRKPEYMCVCVCVFVFFFLLSLSLSLSLFSFDRHYLLLFFYFISIK